MHEIVTGYFKPNAADTAAGITDTFGATTNIINGGIECSLGMNTAANARADFYKSFLGYFSLPAEEEAGLTCGSMRHFP